MKRLQRISFVMVFALLVSIVLPGMGYGVPVLNVAAAEPEMVTVMVNSFETADDYWASPGITRTLEASDKTEGNAAVSITYDKTATGDVQWPAYIMADLAVEVTEGSSLKMDIKPIAGAANANGLLNIKVFDTEDNVDELSIISLTGNWDTVTVLLTNNNGTIAKIEFWVFIGSAAWGSETTATYLFDNLRLIKPVVDNGEEPQEEPTQEVGTKLLFSYDNLSELWVSPGLSANEETVDKTQGDGAISVTYDQSNTDGGTWPSIIKDGLDLDVAGATELELDIKPSVATTLAEDVLRLKIFYDGSDAYDTTVGVLAEGWNTVSVPYDNSQGNIIKIELYVARDSSYWPEGVTTATYLIDNFRAIGIFDGAQLPVYELLFETFENEDLVSTEKGITKELIHDNVAEGNSALQLTYTKADFGGQWSHSILSLDNPVDLSSAKGFYIDVFPTSQSGSGKEPLVLKVMDNLGKGVYEKALPQLTANEWNSVYVNFGDKHWEAGSQGAVSTIEFYVDRDNVTDWDGRDAVSYALDNMTVRLLGEPIIEAVVAPGQVPKGSLVNLTPLGPGTIVYTTDGSNPLTSETAQTFSDSILIEHNTVITAALVDGDSNSFLHTFRYGATKPIDVDLTTGFAGNIIPNDQETVFDITIDNVSPSSYELSIEYDVRDYKGNTVYSGSDVGMNLGVDSGLSIQKKLDIDANGVFIMTVNIYDTNGIVNETYTSSFSQVLPLVNDRGDGIFGVCTHFGQARGDVEKNLDIAALGGMQVIRDEMLWKDMEIVKDQLIVQNSWQTYLDAATARGMETLVILNYGNKFYIDDDDYKFADVDFPSSQAAIDGFVRYATTLAEYYNGQNGHGHIKYFEVWNEPNLGDNGEGPDVYADLLKAVYPAVKAVNPEAVIIAGATAGAPVTWMGDMLATDDSEEEDFAINYMDAVSIHPYSWPTGPEAGGFVTKLEEVDTLIRSYNNDVSIPIWVTEMGWPSYIGDRGIDDITNAYYLARTYVVGMASGLAEKIFWYDLQDDGGNDTYSEDRFGMIEYWFDDQSPYAAKPNYVAYNAMTNQLIGAEFIDSKKPDADMNLYKFHREADQKDVLVAWDLHNTRSIGLNVGEGTYNVMDVFGNSKLYTAINGVISVTISEAPIYIEGTIDNYAIADSSFRLSDTKLNVLNDQTFDVTIERDATVQGLDGELLVNLPDGWTIESATAFLAGSEPITLTLGVPANAVKRIYDIDISVVSNGDVYSELKLQAQITDPVLVTVVPTPEMPLESNNWSLDITLTNISSLAYGGTLTISGDEVFQGTQPIVFDEIAGGSEIQVSLPVIDPDQILYDLHMDIELSTGYQTSIDRSTSFLVVAESRTPIQIDGTLDSGEWSGSVPIVMDTVEQYLPMWPNYTEWGGLTDQAVVGQLKWDTDNLYFAVEVVDNVHSEPYGASGAWEGDSIQMAIDPYRMNGPSETGNNHEMTIALKDDGTIIAYRGTATAGQSQGDMMMDCVIVRDESAKTTTYEMALPWNQLLPEGVEPQVALTYGFSFLLNDNDGDDRNGGLTYMAGIGTEKDPALYGDMVLIEAVAGNTDNTTGNNGTESKSNDSSSSNSNNPKIDEESGRATVTLDRLELDKALEGSNTASVKVPNVEGANGYTVVLPAANLVSDNKEQRIQIATEFGEVELPATMLKTTKLSESINVELSVELVDRNALPSTVKDLVGDRPIVELNLSQDGKTIAWSNPDSPVKVTIPYKPTAAELANPEHIVVRYIDGSGKIIAVPSGRYDAAKGVVTFTTTHFSKYAVAYVNKSFNDLQDYAWASTAVNVMASKGIINGTSLTTYSPSLDVKRGDFIKLLVASLELTSSNKDDNFVDVKPTAYYADSIAVAKALGITKGVGDNRFAPEAKITRQEMMTMIVRAMEVAKKDMVQGDESELNKYVDRSSVSAYAVESLATLVKNGIVKGNGQQLNPLAKATRAETAVLIYKIYNK